RSSTTFGWCRSAPMRASRRNSWRRCGSSACAPRMSLSATSGPPSPLRARNTSPMPPTPGRAEMAKGPRRTVCRSATTLIDGTRTALASPAPEARVVRIERVAVGRGLLAEVLVRRLELRRAAPEQPTHARAGVTGRLAHHRPAARAVVVGAIAGEGVLVGELLLD